MRSAYMQRGAKEWRAENHGAQAITSIDRGSREARRSDHVGNRTIRENLRSARTRPPVWDVGGPCALTVVFVTERHS
jgi:hypothetical protein